MGSQGLSYTEKLREKGKKNLPIVYLICVRDCAISVYILFQYAPFNQSILKEISPEYSLEGLMLKLKLQSFGTWCEELTHLKRAWCWERLKVRGEGDGWGWDGWMASPTQWTWVWVNSGSWWWTGKPGLLQSMGSQRVGHDWDPEMNWTELTEALSKPIWPPRWH